MQPQFKIGETVQLSEAGRENENYEDRPLKITAIYDHYTPAARMVHDPTGHPGYDSDVNEPLYDFENYPHALYEYEIEEKEA